MMKNKSFILDVFDDKECDEIVLDIEKNKDNIKISTDHGVERISSYELDVKFFSKKIKDIIDLKIEEKIKPITGGNLGMIFAVRYSLDTKSYMNNHYDCNSYSCVITLNDTFEGGGTYFPLTEELINPKKGQGIMFLADEYESYHSAYPITSGVRYVLVIRIEKKSNFKLILKTLYLHFVDVFLRKVKKIQ
jgi:hypothetical protein